MGKINPYLLYLILYILLKAILGLINHLLLILGLGMW